MLRGVMLIWSMLRPLETEESGLLEEMYYGIHDIFRLAAISLIYEMESTRATIWSLILRDSILVKVY